MISFRKARPRWVFASLAALLALCTWTSSAQAAPALGFSSFSAGALNADGTPFTQAGAPPFELQTSFAFDTVLDSRTGGDVPGASIKDTTVDFPPGMLGDPSAVPQCNQRDMAVPRLGYCPTDTQIGYAVLDVNFLFGRQTYTAAVYNMVPPPGVPAQFAFVIVASIAHIDVNVRSDGDYGATATVRNTNSATPVFGAKVHIWGVPSDSSHDVWRFEPSLTAPGDFNGNPIPSHLISKPLLRNPTSCSGPTTTTIRATSWQEPDEVVEASSTAPATTGCAAVPFAPTVSVAPDSKQAGSSAGYGIDLKLPQNDTPEGLATSDLKKVVMTLPRGVAINPSSADGLAGCADRDFAVSSVAEDNCPNASKIGSVEIKTPLLDDPLGGSLFLAAPLEQSPAAAASGRMYRLFLEAEGSGVRIKRIGTVVPDPVTGQLTATFDDNPQLPFETLHVELNGGPRSPLTTPQSCGTYTTHAELTPWARPSEPVGVDSSFQVSEGCANASKFEPSLEAGATNPVGGGFSPFLFRVSAPSGQQNLAQIQATLPEGVLAKLKGVAVCGDGAAAAGSCPASSQVGTTTVGAGNGTSPVYVPQPGRAPTAVYLAGPYKGAPYSLVVKVPAQAGPFDLGTVSVRNALYVDPTTAQVTAKSDPLPQILLGVPITYRDVRVNVDRPDFTLNPTNCNPLKVTSTLASVAGATANPSDRFQVAGCGELGFKPSLALSFSGQTKRSGNPALTAVLKAAAGEANIAKTAVLLPSTQFIDNQHINNPCTRPQFNANACPASSVLGTATAYTPLLDKPLTGKVYFRSNGGERDLPDLVVDLNGQIHVTLVGFIDSVGKKGSEQRRVRTRFQNVPDAPVSRFVLKLKGGKRGLIENSTNICKRLGPATVQMQGQNAKPNDFDVAIATGCGKKSKRRG